MRKSIAAILICLSASFAGAQTIDVDWALSFGGGDGDEGESVTTDNHGNVYVTGHFSDTVDFDPGAGNDVLKTRASTNSR